MKVSDLLSSTDVTADLVVVDKQQLLHELARRPEPSSMCCRIAFPPNSRSVRH
jgi:hypothetical protein